jgi:excinuclease ABC subunit C
MSNLKETIKNLPAMPGVYHFLDAEKTVLYVGKAKNLRNRLRQYFLKELGRGPAIEQMVRLASEIKYIETDSEIEAVILEAELIRKLKPKYNVRLKDDKSFLAIKIAKKSHSSGKDTGIQTIGMIESGVCMTPDVISKEAYPAVEFVRYKNIDLNDKSADYFGPYPSGLLLKKSVNFLRKVFPFRDCSKAKWASQSKKCRPCIYGDIRVCSAPCCGWTDEEHYNRNILYLKNFLRGKKKEIVKSLEKEMKQLSEARDFERAALVRDNLAALGHLKEVAIGLRDDVFDREKILFKRIECYDISNISGEYATGSMVVMTDGKIDKDEYRKFKIRSCSHPDSLLRRSRPFLRHSERSEESPCTKVDRSFANSQDDNNLVAELPNNDLSRLQQVLERRLANDWPLPDLVVIDGGPLHLRVAKEVAKEFKFDFPIISISKGPERKKNDFHFSNSDIAKYFQGNTTLQNICIQARDESHRFAIEYYRKLHAKDMLEK